MRVVVVASTFPESAEDAVPAFVKDLVLSLKSCRPELTLDVLAPQVGGSSAAEVERPEFRELRFPYAYPKRLQLLAGRGILPTIESRPVLVGLVPLLFLGEFLALLSYVRSCKPDVIYAHWFTPQGVCAAAVSRLTGVPWVMTTHANDVRVWNKVPGGRAMVRALLPTAQRITAVSGATLSKMEGFFSVEEWQALKSRTAILPMGVYVESLLGFSSPNDDAEPYLYFIGRLAEKKGLTYLLDALALMSQPPRLIVAGDGPLRQALTDKVKVLGLEGRVEFVGFVTGERKNDLFERATVVVVPSIETDSGDAEGLPVVVLEALAAGKLCVVTDATNAQGVVVEGDTGFLVPQKNARELATKLSQVLSLQCHEADAVRERARQAARSFDWATIALKHYEFLLEPFRPA